jgi:ATP-dependent RNA helicase DeaD
MENLTEILTDRDLPLNRKNRRKYMQETNVTFKELGVSSAILRSLDKMGFTTATPVQSKVIKPMAQGRDIMALAPTGTGKTAAFGIPIIEKVNKKDSRVQVLILCPTRELATQTTAVLHALTGFSHGVRVQALYGGAPIQKQIQALKKRPQVIVATPGRLKDHMKRRTVRLDSTSIIVLDEADRMLDMGFRDDIKNILNKAPEERQTVMFSATMSSEVLSIAQQYQRDAFEVTIKQEQKTVDTVTQYYAEIHGKKKESTLVNLLGDENFNLSLVFVARKHRADDVAKTLAANNINAAALHGDMRQSQRDRVMGNYKRGNLDVLVATDVAARGIDVNDIDVVINYDLPQDSDSYIHRIGRTGRAKKNGVAYTFLASSEVGKFRQIMKKTKTNVTGVKLQPTEDFVSAKRNAAKSKPKFNGNTRGSGDARVGGGSSGSSGGRGSGGSRGSRGGSGTARIGGGNSGNRGGSNNARRPKPGRGFRQN